MNQSFIILYAGAPMKLPEIQMCEPREATVFANEVDAWAAIKNHYITVKYCRVVDLNKYIEQGHNQYAF
jgi:hypothetical protein